MPSAPHLLAIESATEVLSTALLRGETVLAEVRGAPGQHHAETVLRQVDEVLRAGELALAEIEAFAVSIGPGSFTSLRIGLASVKGLAFGGDAPVAPISTLAALAWGAGRDSAADRSVIPALDALRGEFYAAGFVWQGDALVEVIPEGIYRPDALAALLPGSSLLVGPGAASLGDGLRDLAAPLLPSLETGTTAAPTAAVVGALGARCLAAGACVAAAEVVPRYLRRSQAEELRAARERPEGAPRA